MWEDRFYYIYLWIVYNLLDVITTQFGLQVGLVEANPLPALVISFSSPMTLHIYKLTVAMLWLIVILWFVRDWRGWLALRIGNILVAGAVLSNLLLIGPRLL